MVPLVRLLLAAALVWLLAFDELETTALSRELPPPPLCVVDDDEVVTHVSERGNRNKALNNID